MVQMRLTAAVTKEGKWYVARCLEVEVTSQGETMEEALENLREALELYFDDDKPIEPFNSPIIAPLDVEIRT
jgi:predicted RNase H-like HicB family nuclease